MSLSSAHLTPLPTPSGVPVSVEPIDGTGALRITRRFSVAADLVANGSLAALVEAYGTVDGAYAGADATKRTHEARRIWADARLVELRVLPRPATGSPEGDGATRIVEKVYEQTPYERTTGAQTDAQGAILSTDKTVVCAYGQSLAAAATGYSRVVLGHTQDAGRTVYQVRDVRGQGTLREGYSEDGEGVIVESGSYVTMSEPADPTPGAFDSWVKTAQAGYWRVDYSKPADGQLSPGRIRRNREARADGSVSETVTEAGESPTCAASDYGARTVILVGESTFTRAGGIVGRAKHWLVLPVDRDEPALVHWTQPGVAYIGGTLGTGGNAYLSVSPPVARKLVGTRAMSWGSAVTAVAPWQITSGFAFAVGGTMRDADGGAVPYSRDESLPNVVGSVNIAETAGKWAGMDIVALTGAGSSTPAVLPSGAGVVLDCAIRPYACALDTGVVYYEKETQTADFA